jgi:hypothetical protein
VSVKGVPSGGVSGAAALVGGGAADDIGSVIDFLSGAGWGRVAWLSKPVGPGDNAANLLDVGSLRPFSCSGVRFDGCAAKSTRPWASGVSVDGCADRCTSATGWT